jgi:hypothetical protein
MFVVTADLPSGAVIQNDDRIENPAPEYCVDAENFLKKRWFGLTYDKPDPSGSYVARDVQNAQSHGWSSPMLTLTPNRHETTHSLWQVPYRNLKYDDPQRVGNIWEQLAPKTAQNRDTRCAKVLDETTT